MTHWQPSATIDTLKARALLLQQVRAFFMAREVMEVDTPLVGTASGTDVQLAPLPVGLDPGTGKAVSAWLQTSPEFAMKRLLAAGSGPIFQVCRAFRNGDAGRLHNPEFLMLEWYRPGWALARLMDEVHTLVAEFVPGLPAPVTLTWREAFLETLGIDPFTTASDMLAARARSLTGIDAGAEGPDFWLDLLYTHAVEPALPELCFLTEYPASQAALARIVEDEHGNRVGLRFELIVRGVELANGYDELVDAQEQRQRFEADLAERRARGLPAITIDEHLLAALGQGLPACSGVALGLDRLIMLALGKSSLAEVMPFDISRS